MAPPAQSALPPRKPDPNRFKSEVSMPEGSAKDPDYLRAIQDLEDQLPGRAGWLFAKGAFDKGDLLHLRDEEERRRYEERELREKEALEFAQLRERAAAQTEAGGASGGKPAAAAPGPTQTTRKKKALHVVAVKPAKSMPRSDDDRAVGPSPSSQAGAAGREEGDGGQGPSPKRTRRGGSDDAPGTAPTDKPDLGDLLGAYGSDAESD